MEKLRELETEAQCAAFANNSKSALELYSKCLLLCEQHNLPQEDYKRILGFKVLLQNAQKANKEALYDSVSYVMLDQQSHEGYWYASYAVQNLKRFDKALEFLIKGSTLTEEPSLFLAEIVQILVSRGSSNERLFLEILERYPALDIGSIETQRNVIQRLVDINFWEGVSLLVTGIHKGPASKLDKSASSCSAVGVPVGRLLGNISKNDKQRFGVQLAQALLENGATIQEIEKSMEMPILHVGLKVAMETGNNALLKWLFKNCSRGELHENRSDSDQNSVLHALVKSNMKNEQQELDIFKILLENGCSPHLHDAMGRTPIEYVSKTRRLYPLLNQTTESKVDEQNGLVGEITAQRNDADSGCNVIKTEDECVVRREGAIIILGDTEAKTDFESLVKRANEAFSRKMFTEAFEDYIHAAAILVDDNQQNMREEIVKHLCKCYTRCSSTENCSVPDESLSTLSFGLKCSITFRLIKQRQWTEACTFFEGYIHHASVDTNVTGESIALNHICNERMLSSHVWLAEFIKKMVEEDLVDFRKIKLKPDETYLHSSVKIAFATENGGLLEVVTKKAKRCQEQNQLDRSGNSALHMVAKFPPGNKMAKEVCRILLENQVNPLLQNNDQKTARDLTSPKDKYVTKLLKRHEEKAKKGYHTQKRKKKHRWKKQSRTVIRDTITDSLDEDEHLDTTIGETPIQESPEKCTCRLVIEKIRETKPEKGSTIESLVSVLQENHTSYDHHKTRNECLALIADIVSKSDTPDIPCALTCVAQDVYVDFLRALISLSQWELMCKAVELYREKVDGNALSEFASDMSIVNMIQTVQTTNEDKIVEILKLMLDGGANLEREEERLMQIVLKHSQYKVLEALLRHDINPELLTVYPGDTPIHAALFIGLQLDKGNFTIFKLFIAKYNEDRRKHACLSPKQVDESKNGLFHIVAKESDCSVNHEAARILHKLELPLILKNKEGLLPKDCLVCKHSEMQQIYKSLEEEENDQMKENILTMIYTLRRKTTLQTKCPSDTPHSDASLEIVFDPAYFEDLVWEIQCSKDFLKAIKNKKVHPHLKQKAMQYILELGRGYRWKHLRNKLKHNNSSGPVLYEIKLDKAVRIIWEEAIDLSCRRQDETRCYSEVIRLWDLVLDHDKIHSSVQNILRSYERAKPLPNLTKCIKGKNHNDKHFKAPQTFVYVNPKTEESSIDTHGLYKPVNPHENEFNVMKFYPFSYDVVHSILENSDVELEFPFKVTDDEYLFINMKTNTPILLLGRSGTGKTTCCLYRLWNKFEVYWTEIARMQSAAASVAESIQNGTNDKTDLKGMDDLQKPLDEQCIAEANMQNELKAENTEGRNNATGENDNYFGRHLRQIFVTKNPLLCMEVERNFCDLRHASRVGKMHSSSENNPLPPKLQDVDDLQYPLFITFRKLLQFLDKSITDTNQSMLAKNSNLTNGIQGWSDCNINDDISKLRDSRSICIELSDDELSDDSNDDESTGMVRAISPIKKQQRKSASWKMMTYEIFVKEVWIKMKKENPMCHPSLVWTEIVSFIKGSYEALNSSNGYLNLEEYERLGRKMAPMFTGDRKKIHDLFHIYEHVKKQRSFIDEADITRIIYKKLTNQRDPNLLVHEVYVDETQDFTQAELCVLIQLCRNPSGIFMTGDTAQCIMHGISFRFEDLRTIFYSMSIKQCIGEKNITPKIHHLPHNYRSHAGILNLASSVLELVKEFFPESYDHLEKDSGMLDGPKPVIVLEKRLSDLPKILNKNQRHTSDIELGAHQAILVMNEMTKQRAETVFSKCLVITIDRAKGLEFDDVLLFNFFKESHAKKEWRTVLDYQQKVAVTDTSADAGQTDRNTNDGVPKTCDARALEFDQRKHKVLNTELKLLYTAITRARTNVWIFDEDDESRAPMFYYFQERGLVETTIHVKDFTERSFTKDSSPEEWIAEGNYLYNHRRFKEAAVCYRNGNNLELADYSSARHNEEQAYSCEDESMFRHHLLTATLRYLNCDRIRRTVSCLKKLGEFEILAKLYEHINEMKRAANVYKDLKKPLEQSRCLEEMKYFGKAMQVLDKSGYFEEMKHCLERYQSTKDSKDEIPTNLNSEPKINYRAATYYGKIRNKDYMMNYCEKITDEKKIEVFISCDFIDEAAYLHQRKGEQKEAIELYIKNGDVQKAERLLDKTIPDYRKLRQSCTIIRGQLAVVDQEAEGVDKSLENLDEIINDKTAETLLTANATLIRGQLKGNQYDIERAYHIFANDKAGYFGQLECIDLMMAKMDLTDFKDVCGILTYLGELNPPFHYLLLENYCLPKDRFSVSDYMFYGFQYEEISNRYKLYPRQASRARYFCASDTKFEICFHEEKMRNSISDFITKRTKQWLHKLQAIIDSQRMEMETFLQNPKTTIVPKTIKHIASIQEKKEECFLRLLQFHVLTVWLSFTSDEEHLEHRKCETFLEVLCSLRCVQVIPEHNTQLKSRAYKLLRESGLKVFQNEVVRYSKAKFNQLETTKGNTVSDFVEIILLQNVMDLTDVNVLEMMEKYESKRLADAEHLISNCVDKESLSKLRSKVKPHGIDVTRGEDNGNIVFTSIAKPFSATIGYMNSSNTNSAVNSFNQFCFILQMNYLKKDKFQIPINIFLFWSETIFAISLLHAVRKDAGAIMPDAFLSRIHYAETFFMKNSPSCIIEQITAYKSKNGISGFGLKNLIHILSCRLNLLRLDTKQNPKYCKISVERILVLSLLVLCNLGGIIQYLDDSAQKKLPKLASEVAHTLYNTRKEEALKQMKASRKTLDFIHPLQNILEAHVHFQICTWKTNFDFQNVKSPDEIEKDLPNLYLDKETLKRIQKSAEGDKPSAKSESCESKNNTTSTKLEYEEEFPEPVKMLTPQQTSGENRQKRGRKSKRFPAIKADNLKEEPQKYTILYQRIPYVNKELDTLEMSINSRHHGLLAQPD
ncbi:uncharacterized protein LOC125653487 isoform X3 [Ostrea edulis]|uniref:uncharacterized protein LOC125653487 isoform X3 n=1 Tax=Ostrea edulis TaxID=37623 RepID=UPI0024AF0CDA|nr:uncharacterized protein LOC125653487 isoform X3 [Ostrea edulis]